MAYSVNTVVNTLLDRANMCGISDMSPMKIQKLLYYAQAWYLKLNDGNPLIDEYFSRWDYGPVIPSLYHDLKANGYGCVTDKLGNVIVVDGKFQYVSSTIEDPNIIAFLDKILEVYGNYTAFQLSNMTHQQGTAWSDGGGPNGTPIVFDDMIREVS